jgi:hypothetical protein
MGGVDGPDGYILGPDRSVEDVLSVTAELLCSEGIDPTWPGFDGAGATPSKPHGS